MFRKALAFGLVTIIGAAALAGCNSGDVNIAGGNMVNGSGKVITEQRSVSGFSEIEVNGTGLLKLQQGDTESVSVQGDDNIIALLKTDLEGSKLHIHFADNTNIGTVSSLIYTVTTKDVKALTLSGVTKGETGSLKTDVLTIEVSGAAGLNTEGVTGSSINATVSGTGSVTINGGTVDKQTVKASGSSAYDAGMLASKTAGVTSSGTSKVTVRVSDSLTAESSGASKVSYVGNPSVTKDTSGTSSVERVEQK